MALLRPRAALALLALLGQLPAPAPAGAQAYRAQEVEAAFLYNFAKFVEWPAAAFADAAAPLTLCIHGPDPFGPFLDRLVEGETVGGRRLVVERGRPLERLRSCHVLYVTGHERGRYAPVLDRVAGASVLTVGEADGFLAAGGLLRFVTREGKVRFQANLPAIEGSDLQVSSKLLRLAVPSEPRRER